MSHKTMDQLPLYLPPQRCLTCGKPFAEKWLEFTRRRLELNDHKPADLPLKIITKDVLQQKDNRTAEGKIMDDLGMTRYCCRRMFLGQPEAEVPPPSK